jgi:hypothetical protein
VILLLLFLLNFIASISGASETHSPPPAPASASDHGQFAKWSKIEIVFTGPDSQGRGEPNPFAILFDVNFTSPSGKQYSVPGLYDGDGKGGLDGNVWKVRFSADELGQWNFSTSSDNTILDGRTGRFVVTLPMEDAPGYWKWGWLESIGTAQNKIRYLKFRDGPYWLKAGCDDPENLLGSYRNYNTLAKRKAAVDYARFGYLPALVFNFGEEHNENYSLPQALEFMRQLRQIDPYDHPRGIHNVNQPTDDYVDAEYIDLTSIQTGSPGSRTGLQNALEHNRIAIDWINRCLVRKKRVLVVNFDEARPEEDRRCWWSVYLGGGVWETHVRQPYDRPFSTWEPAWIQLGGARAFMESLPFWEMQPHNELVTDGRAFCFAKPGHVYALYLPTGGSITISLEPNGTYEVAWWNPANGRDGDFQGKKTITGGLQRLIAPSDGDWALRINREAVP